MRERIPTALSVAEELTLRRLGHNVKVLEIGSLLGASTVALAKTARVVHSVDPHEGYPLDDPKPTLLPFLDNLDREEVRAKVVVHIGRFQDVLPSLRRRWFDLVFIDISGLYHDTYDCLTASHSLLEIGGTLTVHDYGIPSWPGAGEAVDSFSRRLDWPFTLVDSLAIFDAR